jgi:hypothetical protein
MADDPVALPADITIRNPGPSSATGLTTEQIRANGTGSIVLPADVSMRLPGTGNRDTSTNLLRSATLPRATTAPATVVPRQRFAVEPKR